MHIVKTITDIPEAINKYCKAQDADFFLDGETVHLVVASDFKKGRKGIVFTNSEDEIPYYIQDWKFPLKPTLIPGVCVLPVTLRAYYKLEMVDYVNSGSNVP